VLASIVDLKWVIFKLSIYFEHMFLASIKHKFREDIFFKTVTHTNTILIT